MNAGLSRSEGGFKENKVSSASVLDVQAANDKKGKPYYKYEILTRTGKTTLVGLLTRAEHVDLHCLVSLSVSQKASSSSRNS